MEFNKRGIGDPLNLLHVKVTMIIVIVTVAVLNGLSLDPEIYTKPDSKAVQAYLATIKGFR